MNPYKTLYFTNVVKEVLFYHASFPCGQKHSKVLIWIFYSFQCTKGLALNMQLHNFIWLNLGQLK